MTVPFHPNLSTWTNLLIVGERDHKRVLTQDNPDEVNLNDKTMLSEACLHATFTY